MFRLVVSYPKPDEPEQFSAYYEGHHLPLASGLPGLLDARFGYPKALSRGDNQPFCIFEADFENEQALMAALGSDLGKQVAADVKNYSPKGCTISMHEVRALPTA